MKAKGIFSRQDNGFVPADARAKEIHDGIKPGQKVLMWVHTARYLEHHRLAFAVFDRIGEAKGVSALVVAKWLETELGHFEFEKQMDGSYKVEPHSLSFESMSQEEFSSFWKEAEVIIKERLAPELPPDVFAEIKRIAWEK